MDKLIAEVQAPHALHHVPPSQISDRGQPAIDPDTKLRTWDKQGLLQEVAAPHELHHVPPSEISDHSQPVIDPDVHLQPNHHKELMTEVKAAAAHSQVVREMQAVSNAAGAGDGDEDSRTSALVGQLQHVDTADKGQPSIDPNTKLRTWDKQGLLQEVAAPHELHHVPPSEISDHSKPVIPADAHVRDNPAKEVLARIASGELPALKHVVQ